MTRAVAAIIAGHIHLIHRDLSIGRIWYLCEVRAGQYWRLENLKSFDEFLARRFPESRRKAYYLMPIHEHLPPQARKDLKEVKDGRRD